MSNRSLDDFDEVEKPEPNVGGSFRCQECNERVSGAFKKDGLLVWYCSEGHESKIKDFYV